MQSRAIGCSFSSQTRNKAAFQGTAFHADLSALQDVLHGVTGEPLAVTLKRSDVTEFTCLIVDKSRRRSVDLQPFDECLVDITKDVELKALAGKKLLDPLRAVGGMGIDGVHLHFGAFQAR